MDVLDHETLRSLRELQEDGDDDLLGELIDLFLADAPARIDAIRAAVARQDWAALTAPAHSLKGSCGSLGAFPLAELCGRLEHCGRQDADRSHAAADCAELDRQYRLVREALLRERGARDSSCS
jgi:HPt (histidine-containing phosphotransfer) domain-containing protein